MIQDLEGATPEPARRRHVAALSAVTAAAAIVLFYALVAPAPRTDTSPLAASPAPTSVSRAVVTFASDSTTWAELIEPMSIRPDLWGPFIVRRPADETWTECAAGIGSSPPVTLVFDRDGRRLVAAYTSGQTGRFIPLPKAYVDSGWVSVPCDTSDVFAPRINRAR